MQLCKKDKHRGIKKNKKKLKREKSVNMVIFYQKIGKYDEKWKKTR